MGINTSAQEACQVTTFNQQLKSIESRPCERQHSLVSAAFSGAGGSQIDDSAQTLSTGSSAFPQLYPRIYPQPMFGDPSRTAGTYDETAQCANTKAVSSPTAMPTTEGTAMQSTNDRASTRKEAARQHLVIFRRNLDEKARYYVALAEQYGLTIDEIVEASGLSDATVRSVLRGATDGSH